MSNVFEIKPGIFYTGVVDKDLEIFDIIMETKYGTTYNSYLIKGEKTVLVLLQKRLMDILLIIFKK